jgi:hypothetical protein
MYRVTFPKKKKRIKRRCASEKTSETEAMKTILERDEMKLAEPSNTERRVIFHERHHLITKHVSLL